MLILLGALCFGGAQGVAYAEDSSLSLSSSGGDPVGGLGEPLALSTQNAVFSGGGIQRNSGEIVVKPTGTGTEWKFAISRPGRWTAIRPGIFGEGSAEPAWVPGCALLVTAPGGIAATSYRTEIKQVSFDSPENLRVLWVIFESRVPGVAGVLRGELRFHLEAQIFQPVRFDPAVLVSDYRGPGCPRCR